MHILWTLGTKKWDALNHETEVQRCGQSVHIFRGGYLSSCHKNVAFWTLSELLFNVHIWDGGLYCNNNVLT